jgi:hypothetical protein
MDTCSLVFVWSFPSCTPLLSSTAVLFSSLQSSSGFPWWTRWRGGARPCKCSSTEEETTEALTRWQAAAACVAGKSGSSVQQGEAAAVCVARILLKLPTARSSSSYIAQRPSWPCTLHHRRASRCDDADAANLHDDDIRSQHSFFSGQPVCQLLFKCSMSIILWKLSNTVT